MSEKELLEFLMRVIRNYCGEMQRVVNYTAKCKNPDKQLLELVEIITKDGKRFSEELVSLWCKMKDEAHLLQMIYDNREAMEKLIN